MKKYFFTKEEIFKKHKTESHRCYYGNNATDRKNEFVRYIAIKTSPGTIETSSYKRVGNTDYFKQIKGFYHDSDRDKIIDEAINWVKITGVVA